ncbi:hypothetical protein V5799_023964 [Amblyomma americanum]|uniref:Secreted protein n=1 Tax=Amblyomma americanum TaxID=6943 RepID=A0AAQ4FG36_AMBAM
MATASFGCSFVAVLQLLTADTYQSKAMKFLAIGVLVYVLLTQVARADPVCPGLYCKPGSKVGCYITAEECRCFCVEDQDPCDYVRESFPSACRAPEALQCYTEAFAPCKCRCGTSPP